MVNTVPRFIATPKAWAIAVPAATPRAEPDGSGTVVTLVTAGDNGSKVDSYIFTGEGDIQDTRLLLFLQTPGGTNHLVREIAVAGTSAAAGVTPGFNAEHSPTNPHIVPASWSLVIGSAETTNVYNVIAVGGDY